MSRSIRAVLFALVLAASTGAFADVAPRPTRPGWDSPPAPLPTPPELVVIVAVVIVAVVLVAALIALARRRSVRSEEAPS
ncbi:MAG: hypothetical protein JNK05_39565 [Myxococcales bacterium]|nr:hypothetical protein [Myxococcales bacterium]